MTQPPDPAHLCPPVAAPDTPRRIQADMTWETDLPLLSRRMLGQ